MKDFECIAIQDNLRPVLAMAAEQLLAADTDMTVRQKLFVILEELYNNVALHAYADRIAGTVRISLLADYDAVQLKIQDQGPPFNPLEHDDSQRLQNLLDMKEGGEGIFLVKTLAAKVEYDFIDEWNCISVLIT